jgi:hypothetical protein
MYTIRKREMLRNMKNRWKISNTGKEITTQKKKMEKQCKKE